jgi:ligand-binding sensor domain-containing protein/DNA-binding CsgD family transcriptional regulator
MIKLRHLVVLLFASTLAVAQNTIGLPDIVNYSIEVTKGAQNRQIRQDKKGILYFANNEGVLTFDGIKWKTYPLPNKSIVRSIEFGPDNKLYVGGQDEFGYFEPSANGQLVFHSLKSLIPETERSFTDVWEIIFYKNGAFFQTTERIFYLTDNHISVFKSKHWRFISTCAEKLIAQEDSKGLLKFENGVWAPFLKYSELPKDYFASSLTMIGKDTALLSTVKHGIYILSGDRISKLNSAFLEQLSSKNISASAMVNEKHIAIATNLAGCYIIDKQGNLIRSFTRKEGLQNNNILNVFLDKEKNLWLGLDNGIDFIAYNNAIKHIYPEYLNEAAGYASYVYKNDLFIGMSNGLYKVPLYNQTDLSYIKGNFLPVNNTKGQVWNLSEVNGKLLMGHHEGAFKIENNTATAIDNSSGFWNFLPYQNVLPSSLMVSGTYEGINFYDYKNGTFTRKNTHAHFESARFVVIDNNHIWVAHPYKGLYRIDITNDQPVIKYYTIKEGVPSKNGNFIFKVRNSLVLTTETGIFEYNVNLDKFEPSNYYNDLFGKKQIRYLKEDASGNVWFVYDKILGVVDNSTSPAQIIYFPELNNKFVAGFEHVNPIDKNNVLIGGEKGFYHINYEQYKKIKYPLQAHITSVFAIGSKDSLLFGGYTNSVNEDNSNQNFKTKISHDWNSFRFEFAAPDYSQLSNIEYSYQLKGFDEKWSEFSKKSEKEYTNIPAGIYTFKVKARNNLGNESAESTYTFSVLPPWYETWWAFSLYISLVVIAAAAYYKHQKKKFYLQEVKHEEEQKRLQYLHQLELQKTEKELVELRNEKLEAEINHKNTQLASTAMHLVQKGELLGKVKEQMLKLKKHSDIDKDADELKKIIKRISEEDKMDQQWEQFSVHFDTVHSDFLSHIKTKYPHLTPNELKLCAYLRMNLSTKEMAQLMNISVRGVEISRYRLRKKLKVATEMNLFDFLMDVTK